MFKKLYKKILYFLRYIFTKKSNRFRYREKSRKKFLLVVIIFLLILLIFIFNRIKSDENLQNNNQHDCLQLPDMNWCASSKECFKVGEYMCPDEINSLILEIEEKTGEKFINTGSSSFSWMVDISEDKESEQVIHGVAYESYLNLNQVRLVENYFEQKAIFDPFNIADGVAGGFRGYYYQKYVCVFDFRYKEMKSEAEIMKPVNDLLRVKIKCGPWLK